MLLFMRTAWPGLVTCNRARGVLVVGVARLYPPPAEYMVRKSGSLRCGSGGSWRDASTPKSRPHHQIPVAAPTHTGCPLCTTLSALQAPYWRTSYDIS